MCFALGLGGLWLMSLPVVVQWSAGLLEREPPLARGEWAVLGQRADAIVVLGSGRERGDAAWGADQPTGVGLERQRFAARLAKASGLPVLTSGGLHYGTPPSEAQMMADSLRDDFGVTVRWQEGRSRTTWENARFSAKVLLPQGIKRVVLVTHAGHMPRAVWSFRKAGFEAGAGAGRVSGRRQCAATGWLDAGVQGDLAERAIDERGGGAGRLFVVLPVKIKDRSLRQLLQLECNPL